MATHNLNFADENFINSIVQSEELVKRVPRLVKYWEAVKEMKEAQADVSVRGQFTRAAGFWANGTMQRVASIPYSIAAAILEVDPEFFRDRGKVYRFLAQNPEYDTRSRVP